MILFSYILVRVSFWIDGTAMALKEASVMYKNKYLELLKNLFAKKWISLTICQGPVNPFVFSLH